jgi:hypothetical protein
MGRRGASENLASPATMTKNRLVPVGIQDQRIATKMLILNLTRMAKMAVSQWTIGHRQVHCDTGLKQ